MNIWHVTKDEVAEGCSSVTGGCNLAGADKHYTSEEAAVFASGSPARIMPDKLQLVSAPHMQELKRLKQKIGQMQRPEVYIHPQGKMILADAATKRVQAYKTGSQVGTTATIEKLQAGHGAWKRLEDNALRDALNQL